MNETLAERIALLDHFAGLAMQGIISSDREYEYSLGIFECSYDYANHMLIERDRRIEFMKKALRQD